MVCSIEGCEAKVLARGWCNKHYKRWRRHGDPTTTKVKRWQTLEERFWSKVDIKGENDCWEWTAVKYGRSREYGCFYDNGKGIPAHRFAYELVNETKVPEHLQVCHNCFNKSCVNPNHLRVDTQSGNLMDADASGEQHHKTVVPDCLVVTAIALCNSGCFQKDVAEWLTDLGYKTTCSTVCRWVNGERRKLAYRLYEKFMVMHTP